MSEDRPYEIVLAELRSKELAALSESDVEFLRSRKSYLTSDEIEKFGLNEKAPVTPDAEEAPAKKGKSKKADAEEAPAA